MMVDGCRSGARLGGERRVVRWVDLRFDGVVSAGAAPQILHRYGLSGATRSTGVGWAKADSAGSSSRPVQAADVAQARLFSELLQGEVVRLQGVVVAAEERWMCPDRRANEPVPEPVRRVRARLEEVGWMLQALRDRFPHA